MLPLRWGRGLNNPAVPDMSGRLRYEPFSAAGIIKRGNGYEIHNDRLRDYVCYHSYKVDLGRSPARGY